MNGGLMKFIISMMLSILLLGCSAPAVLNFTPSDLSPVSVAQKINAEIKTINVSIATKEEQKGYLQVGFFGNQYEQSFKSTFKDAIEESLARTAIFNDDSNNKVSLSAKVLKFDSPGNNTTSNTYMIVKYEFLNRKTGMSVYTTEIDSFGSVPLNYAFIGDVRFTEARNRAVKENIKKLINDLKSNRFIK